MGGRLDLVTCEKLGATARLRLNRPERLNAVSLALYLALEEALAGLAQDPSIRSILLTGSGRAFCAGADLEAHGRGGLTQAERRIYVEAGQRVQRLLQTLPKPIVAAVNGAAVGAGLEMALACDLVIVAREAKLRFPELSLGTFFGGGMTYMLVQRVGFTRAKELLMLGEFFSGEDAAAMGLANRAVPSDLVLETAATLADELASKAPIPMSYAKRLLDQVRNLDAESALALEADALLDCMASRDWQEGIHSFQERRPPRFIGE